jgi:hypothetical protein
MLLCLFRDFQQPNLQEGEGESNQNVPAPTAYHLERQPAYETDFSRPPNTG